MKKGKVSKIIKYIYLYRIKYSKGKYENQRRKFKICELKNGEI